ncbi:hypothetical protein SLS64_009252 [Diaporthe eres]
MWEAPISPWAAAPPPGQERHEEYYSGISTSLIGVGLFSTILAVAVVCLRLYSRIFSARGLRADDYLIILATGFLIGFFAICVRLTVYGVGTHVWDVYMANYTPGILQLIVFSQILGCLMVSFNKLSVLSLYVTITPNKKFRAVVYSLMGFVIGFTLAYVLVQILDCNPVQGQWDLRLFQTTQCIDSTVSPMQILSVVNILVDLAVVVLPIPVILPLPLSKKDKASCLLLFAAGGGLVCIAAVGRTVELTPLLHPRSSGFVDVTWVIVPELNWAFAEGSIGIVAASLPAIRPLFIRLLSKIRGTASSENDRPVVSLEDMIDSIGQDLAERLHPQGYNIVVSGRRSKEGQAVASQLDPTGETAIFVQCDVVSYASQANLFKTAWDKWNRLDAFVANAGAVDRGSRYNLGRRGAAVGDAPPEPDLSCTDIDVKGVIFGTELAVHYMRHNPEQARGGKIIVTGSAAAIYPVVNLPEYSAAKAAALQFARVMAPMLALEGITINNVLPNGYDTDIMPGFKEAFLDEHLTKKECIMTAFEVFLDDVAGEKTGQAIETAYESHYYHEVPPGKSGEVNERVVKVYEPWFEMMHGARSGLPGTIKEPLRKLSK